jgi:ATP-dependent Zn protease
MRGALSGFAEGAVAYDMETSREVAYHEAGHAVIGRILGLTCGSATIVPDYDDGSAGNAVTEIERSAEDWDCRGRPGRWVSLCRARIMMLMADRESEIECLGKNGNDAFGDGEDLRGIQDTISEAFSLEEFEDEAFLARMLTTMRAKTRGLVRRHRNAIAQVASALIKHGSLDERQIDSIAIASGVRLIERVAPATVSINERLARAQARAMCVKLFR